MLKGISFQFDFVLLIAILFALQFNLNTVEGSYSVISSRDHHSHWNYHDTSSWLTKYKQCGGTSQSPINIEPFRARRYSFNPFFFKNYDKFYRVKMKNNGHSVQIKLANARLNNRPFIQGGGLLGKYYFDQLHLHWGRNSYHGSEHTIRSKHFSAEMHLVHFNSKYNSVEEALKHNDGLAVLAVLFQRSAYPGSTMNLVTKNLYKIKKSGKETTLRSIRLRNFLPRTDKFYRYFGSLTTPRCQEVVTWTVFEEPKTITESQLRRLRSLLDDSGYPLVKNYRPVLRRHPWTKVFRNDMIRRW